MQLANIALLKNSKHLKQHRSQYPAKCERVFDRKGNITRYYSDSPAMLYGEYVRSQIDAPTGRFVYVEKLDDTQWYIGVFSQFTVEQESIGTLARLLIHFSYELHQAPQVLVVSHEFLESFTGDKERCSSITKTDWNTDALVQFQLRPKQAKTLPVKWIAVAGLVVVALAGAAWQFMPATKEGQHTSNIVMRSEADIATEQYLNSYKNDLTDAHATLIAARDLLVEAMVMPNQMTAKLVVLDGQFLSMPLEIGKQRDSLTKEWFSSHPDLTNHYQDNAFRLPLPPPPTRTATGSTPYHKLLIECLQILGGDIQTNNTQQVNGKPVTTYHITIAGNIGIIDVLADILDAPFVALRSLHMNLNEQIVDLTFDVDVEGELKRD
ncbi:hypothetical protein ACP6H1_27275 [Vibrio harveyi]|uniref:hypothetical protein n=1 Tax=Vibrio harveyi TaxID=669 RepID=UPI003CEFBBBC